jgi:hypothetical protein
LIDRPTPLFRTSVKAPHFERGVSAMEAGGTLPVALNNGTFIST